MCVAQWCTGDLDHPPCPSATLRVRPLDYCTLGGGAHSPETGRVLSDESMAFVLAMQDPKATPLQRADALRKAIDVHIAYMSDAANGKVFDRYFLGLRLCIQPGEEVPAIFADPAFAASSNFLLVRVSRASCTGGCRSVQGC